MWSRRRTLRPETTTMAEHVDWLAKYPPPRSLPLDPEALRVYERAYQIGVQTKTEAPPLTFTTVAAALLRSDDDALRETDEPDRLKAALVLEALMRTQPSKYCFELRGWARRVNRHLLQGSAEGVRSKVRRPSRRPAPATSLPS